MLSGSCITGSRGIVKKGVEVMLVREILYICGVERRSSFDCDGKGENLLKCKI